MNKMCNLVVASLLGTSVLISINAFADEPAVVVDAVSPHTFSANVGLYGQYVFRGITYTNERPALQGGFDYSHSSGFYAGVWGSNVQKDSLYGNTLEIDLYGGYAHNFTDDLGINVGILQFYYPDAQKFGGQSANTTELNAAVTYKWLTLKHSIAVSDFFGINSTSMVSNNGDTKGTGYTELNFNYKLPPELQEINIALHVGHQDVKNYSVFSYTDFLIGINKDFSIGSSAGWNAGVNYTTTDAKDAGYFNTALGKNTGDDHAIFFLKRTF